MKVTAYAVLVKHHTLLPVTQVAVEPFMKITTYAVLVKLGQDALMGCTVKCFSYVTEHDEYFFFLVQVFQDVVVNF
jgi:hypothetical protein